MPALLPMIVAHRGLHTEFPENSLQSFKAAANAGLAAVECDVWPSADNQPILIHDPTLQRTTTGTGEVRHHPLDHLRTLGLASLAEVVDALNALSAPTLIVEVKPRINRLFVQSVVKILADYEGICLVQSFHEDNIIETWKHNSWMHTAKLVETKTDLDSAISRGWPSIHAHYSLIDQTVVSTLHSKSRRIGAWTVNETADLERLIHLRIDILITDQPKLAEEIAAAI